MAATIKIKNSSTAGAAPTSSDLVQGELAVNVTDKRLYTENSGGTVVELGTNPSSITLPDGSASAPTLLHSGDTNTGLFFPAADTIALTTGGTERARVDSSGNLGLGVTPSTWLSNRRALEIGGSASAVLALNGTAAVSEIFTNCYRNAAGTYIYAQNGYAGYLNYNNQAGGGWAWSLAPSGTAGATATFTQAMTLDASGNLLVGATSSSFSQAGRGVIEVNGSSTAIMALKAGGTAASYWYYDGANVDFFAIGGALKFGTGTGGAERARIDSSGNLLVGRTSQIATGRLCVQKPNGNYNTIETIQGDAGGYNFYSNAANNGGTYYHCQFTESGTARGSITSNGSSTSYVTSSDYRLKENIQPMTGALVKVAQLKPCTYNWKSDGSAGEGFIAHELAEIVPQCVTGEKDAVDADGNPIYQGIDTSFLVATLTAALQEAHGLIKDLQTRVAALES